MSGKILLYYDFDEFRLDLLNGELLKNGKPIYLTPKSLEILEFFIQNRGRLLKKKELLDSLWSDTFVEESNLIQHIYLLRKVLKQDEKDEILIETIPKNGYRFVGQVEEIYQNETTENYYEELEESVLFETDKAKDPGLIKPHRSNIIPQVLGKFYWKLGFFILLSIIVLGILLYTYQRFATKSNNLATASSIAVLPFQQINSENQENIGLGMTDVIIAQLGKLENVQILPTSSVAQYAENKDLDLFEIGKKLNVDLVLVGTIHREGGQVRITYQVFSVKDKQTIISEKIDEKFINIFALQDAVSEQILQRISLTINPNQSILIMSRILKKEYLK